ncbi:MAG: oligosaccharide flippase family protein [Anaerolineales bacterium]|nr:oligosaccharide flippase family protein [Anaerolineales bacterium]
MSSILGWMTFLITPIFSLGMGTAIATCYYEEKGASRKAETIWSAVTILLVSVTCLIALGAPLAGFWSQLAFQTPDYRSLVAITFLSAGLSILSTPFMMYLQFEERAKLYSVFTALTTVISIGSNVLLVVVFQRGIRGVIEGFLITQVVNLILFAAPAVVNLKYAYKSTVARELLWLGIPLIPSFAFLFLLQQGNRYILQLFGGLDQVGLYTIGYNFGAVMSVPIDALIVAWMPFFMSFLDRQEEARALFGRIVTFYLIGFGVLNMLFYIFAKPVVMLMTQAAFLQAYQVVGLSATAYFLSGLYYLLLPGMYFAKEVRYQSWIHGVAAVLGTALNFLLIWKFNIYGAGLGLALGFFLVVLLTYLWNLKRKTRYIQVQYEWKRIVAFLLFFIVYFVVFQAERNFSLIGESIFSLLSLLPIPFVVYAMLNNWERQNLREWLIQFGTALRGQFSR